MNYEEPDKYCVTEPDGGCSSTDPRCMHQSRVQDKEELCQDEGCDHHGIDHVCINTVGTITFLNMTGDITIAWDASNRESVLAIVQKKMDEGFTFFTTKKVLFDRLKRKVKVTKKNIEVIEEIIITDEQFENMCKDMDDRDVADLVRSEEVDVVKRRGRKTIDALKLAKKPEDVVGKDAIALRPVRGG